MTKTEFYISTIMNGIVFFVTLYITIGILPKTQGKKTFRFYTTDSNIFSGIACGLVFFYQVTHDLFRSGGESIWGIYPHWLVVIKYMSAAAIALTFVTAAFYLGPTTGFKTQFSGISFFRHLVCPVLTVGSFFLENFTKEYGGITLEEAFVAMVPTLIYGLFYIRQVVFVRGNYLLEHPGSEGMENLPGWPDLYGFNKNGKWALPLTIMVALAFVIALGVRAIYNM